MTTPLFDPATKPAYVIETVGLLGDRDPIESMKAMPEWLNEHIALVPDEAWRIPEGPGKWSLIQVVSHLADAEMVFGWRLRLALTMENAPLLGYDQNTWLKRLDYAGNQPQLALATFTMLRIWNLRIWKSCTQQDLDRLAMHAERGPESIGLMRALMAGHDLRHQRQIERLLNVIQ